MSIEVKVPQLPESVTDATLVAWHKSPGDTVERDENLADLETDKVVLEVPSPVHGILKEIRIKGGTVVTSGELLAVLEPAAAQAKGESKTDSKGTDKAPDKPAGKAESPAEAPSGSGNSSSQSAGRNAGKTGPAARRALQEKGVDPATVQGTGPEGRILKSDVVKAAASERSAGTPSGAPRPASDAARPTATGTREPAARGRVAGERAERRVPMSRLRTRIAERMVEAQHNAAMLTTFNEVDLSAVLDLRKRYRDAFEKQHGVRLGFMGFFIKAAIEALRRFPTVNASIEGNEIVYHDYYDIGIAVSTERGLVVPVLRNVDSLGFPGIEAAINDFGQRARDGSLTMDDLTGGTFTITNGGVFGSLLSTPILNPPQSGILGMHQIQERPVVADGQVVARPMMYVALTYDHRIIDGREAVQFLVAIKEALEDPARLMLGV
ncbi:MAG: 2-oxoglutarate dehydrogenase complex dihydrolipoyllysine-residue succinyltransferase [Gammaproteobacteria bacterium]